MRAGQDHEGLAARSVEVILAGQAPSGGYVACPTFPPYGYAWLRDGSFVADAMSRVGERASAEAFFDFVDGLEGFEARYTLDGGHDASGWPLEQHDGWGLWLWAVREHCERHGARNRWDTRRVEEHLERVRGKPCYDWWEEREGVHPATLACIAAGLGEELRPREREVERLDGSLLVLPFLGFGGVDVSELVGPGGGVYRYLGDSFYGGGEWLLLTAMLGLADESRAEECLEWVAARATPAGHLPEQAPGPVQVPEDYDAWVEHWGPPPCPLLWSHAMYLVLAQRLGVSPN